MGYKRRPKNKQELSAKSGTGRKKVIPRKNIVDFQFVTLDGNKYGLNTGRIKINEKGEITCLIKDEEEKWKNIKGTLQYVKMKSIVIKKPDNNKKKR